MTDALDQSARSALERFVQQARRLLEDDLARHAEGHFGIHATDGAIENEDGLHLIPDDLAARRDIVDVLQFIRGEEPDHAAAVARLIREAAFTHLNRLVAIRIAEAIGLLPESLANGSASAGYRELLEVAPLLAHDASGGYWRYLQLCGDELAADLPQLFDPRNPLLELTPSAAAFDELIEKITASDLDPVWDAPDALGWTYQFFNSGDERRAMRDASPSPRNSRELAVRNQFFTPRYVVDFLVHNSLGRRLLEADPTSELIDDLPLLLDPPTESGEPLELVDVRVLDPACGSGHFLLGAYDVLERAWHHAGIEPDAAAPHIVASLWGIDIDPRCAQVASAAIILRARRQCRHHDLPTPNIICARALPEPTEGWDSLLSSLPDDRRHLVAAMRDVLDQAPVLGPLLKVEEQLATEIRARVAGADDTDGTLFAAAGVVNDAFGQAEADVLAVLQQVADQATSGPAVRLFAAEANDAIRFVEALRHRYDAVLMNPPFGAPVEATRGYIVASYPWISTRTKDLSCAFVGRGVELCKPLGTCGAITTRAGLFLSSYENWRREVLLANQVSTIADLGYGVMEQAVVEAAAYTVRKLSADERVSDKTVVLRLVRDVDRQEAILTAARNSRSGLADSRVFAVRPGDFETIPGARLAYWAPRALTKLFKDYPTVEGSSGGTLVRRGLQTGDDFRFVRLAWEVAAGRIDSSGRPTNAIPWVPLAKGGEYAPYWDDLHLVVRWGAGGEDVRSFEGSVVPSPQHYFRGGLTWPRRTASGFGIRVLPEGAIFSDKGPAIITQSDPLLLLAWLSSRAAWACIAILLSSGDEVSSGGVGRSYDTGLVQQLPWPAEAFPDVVAQQMSERMARVVAERKNASVAVETSPAFKPGSLFPPGCETVAECARERISKHEEACLVILHETRQIEDSVLDSIDVDGSLREYVVREFGRHPLDYPHHLQDSALCDRLMSVRIDDLVDECIELAGGGREVANLTFYSDRRIEIIAHALETNAESVVARRRESGLLPHGQEEASARAVLSYLFGVAIGRWQGQSDGEVSRGETKLKHESLVAPFQLIEVDGQASSLLHGSVGSVLLDEPGHPDDCAEALSRAAQDVLEDRADLLSDAVRVAGSRDVRHYLRSKFFRHHLAQYSRSRRKAPIYWPLYVPSGRWGVWVYAQQLSRESLYRVVSEATRRERHAQVEIERLERESALGGGDRGAKALSKALDDERKLAEELRRFRQEAERIAGLGWEPDLDDGTVLCAAPLAELFPQWRKELSKYRDELRAGKYEWSTVSKWADQL